MKRLVRRKRVFRGRLINLYIERQRFPNGYVTDLEVIKHPGAVLIVPFIDEGRIVFIRQYRPVINSYIWELPAGTLHKNESPLNCAKRELAEEIGHRAKMWERIGYIYPAPGYTTETIIIYKAKELKRIESKREEDEIITVKIFARRHIVKLFKSGKIVDAKTISALKLAQIL